MASLGLVEAAWSSITATFEEVAADAAFCDAWAAAVTGGAATDAAIAVSGAGVAIGLPEICIGIVCLVIALCLAELIMQPLGDLLSNVPGIGGWLQDKLYAAHDWIWNSVSNIAHSAWDATTHMAAWVGTLVWGSITAPANAINNLASYTYDIVHQYVPQQIGTVWNHAEALHNAAEADMRTIAGTVWNNAVGLFAAANAHADQDQRNATDYAATLYWDSIHHADAVAAQVEADARTMNDQRIQAGAEMYTAALQHIDAAEARINTEIAQDLNVIQTQISGAVVTTEAAAAVALAGTAAVIEGHIGSLGTSTQTQLDALKNRLKTWEDTCLKDNCEANGQNAKNTLNLKAMLGTGALVAYLIAAVEFPRQTADDTVGVLTPITQPGLDLATEIFGAVV